MCSARQLGDRVGVGGVERARHETAGIEALDGALRAVELEIGDHDVVEPFGRVGRDRDRGAYSSRTDEQYPHAHTVCLSGCQSGRQARSRLNLRNSPSDPSATKPTRANARIDGVLPTCTAAVRVTT